MMTPGSSSYNFDREPGTNLHRCPSWNGPWG